MKLITIKLISLALLLALAVAQDSFACALEEQSDENGVTELMRAARDGEASKVIKLLKRGENLNAQDEWGWTALMYATNNGDDAIVTALIESGADVNLIDKNGLTALRIAKTAEARAQANGVSDVLSQRQAIVEALKGAGAVETPRPTSPPLRIQGATTKPVLLKRLSPSYTVEARKNKVTGIVIMRLLVGEDGTVKKVRIMSGLPHGLSDSAKQTAAQLQFKPATREGKPVEFWIPIEMSFHLR